MRNYILIIIILVLISVSGCTITKESLTDINKEIENKYNSFSTLQYKATEVVYEDNVKKQEIAYTEMVKKPDKIKSLSTLTFGGERGTYGSSVRPAGLHITELLSMYICNQNTAYGQRTDTNITVWNYINLPSNMSSYCSYYITNYEGASKWRIPMELTDETKYKVETSIEDYNGEKSIRIVVTLLMSDDEKEKTVAEGCSPKENQGKHTFYFDMDDFTILKEEYHGYRYEWKMIIIEEEETEEVLVCENESDPSTCVKREKVIKEGKQELKCNEIDVKLERLYEEFLFDLDIPDSEFELNPSDYPDIGFDEITEDVKVFFGEVTIIEAPSVRKPD